MRTFLIDFNGYCKVDAENENEALDIFCENHLQDNEKIKFITFEIIDVEPSE